MKPFSINLAHAGKPVVNRSNQPIIIGSVNLEAMELHQVIGWCDGECASWSSTGQYEVTPSCMDLFMKTEEREISAFLNIYENGDVVAHCSKESADKSALVERIDCVHFTKIYTD